MGRGRPAAGSINKSGEIRKYYELHPDSNIKDCIDFLGKKGIEVSQALVSGVRTRSQGKPGNKKRRGDVTIQEMSLVKNFVNKSGLDVDVATGILEQFASLIDEIGTIERFKEVLSAFGSFESGGVHSAPKISMEEDCVAVSSDGDYEDVNDDEDEDDE